MVTDSIYAVLRHWDQTPIREVMVPVIPTIPSSRLRTPIADNGAAKSHTSEKSCIRAAERSFSIFLASTNTLTLLPVNGLLLLLQLEQSVQTRKSTAQQTSSPSAVRMLLQTLRRLELAETDSINNGNHVEGQVTGVTELTTDAQVAQDRVDRTLVIEGDGSSLEVLSELADTHDLARCAELLLDSIVGVDGGLGLVGAVQVPGVEAGEVLEGTEELVATDGCRDEAQPVRQRWVVNESVGDHVC